MEDLVSATLCTAENVSFELFQTQRHPQPIQNSTCQLNLLVSRSPFITVQPFQTPTNPYLTSTLTSCELQL